LVFHDGRGKDQQRKPPDQDGIDEMDKQVDQVPGTYIQLAEMVIHGKGQERYGAVRARFPDGREIRQVTDLRIVDDGTEVVELEGTIEGIGINDDSEDEDDWQSQKARYIFFFGFLDRCVKYFKQVIFLRGLPFAVNFLPGLWRFHAIKVKKTLTIKWKSNCTLKGTITCSNPV